MSININGNKVAKFGKNLPTAYMDEIQVMTTEVTVMSSCYFLKPENTTEDSFIDYVRDTLSELYLVNILIPDSVTPYIPGIIGVTDDYSLTEEGVENFNNIFNYDGNGNGLDIENVLKQDSSNIFEIMRFCNLSQVRNETTSGFHSFSHIDGTNRIYVPKTETDFDALFYTLADDAFEGYDVLYDNFGNEIIRCRLKQTFSIANDDYDVYDPSAEISGGNYLYVEAMLDFAKFHMLSFTTSLDLETDFYTNYACFDPSSCPDRAYTNKTMKEFYTKQISDVTYETVSNNGSLESVARPVFKLVDSGEIYSPGDILQAIDSLYYTDEGIKREDVIDVFNNLINGAEAALNSADSSVPMSYDISTGYPGVDTSEVSTLRDAIDNLKIILFRSSQKIDLLPKLRLYEKTFPQISTTTATGAFYERFQLALYNTNNAVKRGTQVVKSVNLNRIVVDLISKTSFTYPVELDIFSTAAGSLMFRLPDKNNNYVIANASDDKHLPAAYHCFTDPNKIEKYPVGDDLAELLSTFGISASEFYDFNLSADWTDSVAAAAACREVIAKYVVQSGFRAEGATEAVGTSFRDSRTTGWTSSHDSYIEQLAAALAESYVGDRTFRTYGSVPSGVVAFQQLIDDLTSIAATDLVYTGDNKSYWYPAAVLKHKGEIETNPYGDNDEVDRVTVRLGGQGFDGVLAKEEAGSIYNKLADALDDVVTEGSRGSASTSIKKVVVTLANKFSERASEAWENYYSIVGEVTTGNALVDPASSGPGSTGPVRRSQMYYALTNPNSILCVLYSLSIAIELFMKLEYATSAGSVAQITETNAYLGGYWWFDYEKALKQTSMASYAYKISNVENYFGPAIFSHTYKVTDASVRRYHQKRNSLRKLSKEFTPASGRVGVTPSDERLENVGRIQCVFNSDGTHVVSNHVVAEETSFLAFDPIVDFDSMGTSGIGGRSMQFNVTQYQPEYNVGTVTDPTDIGGLAALELGRDIIDQTGTQYTYLTNRAFQFPSAELSGYSNSADRFYATSDDTGYRLFCFEHQEVAGPYIETDLLTEVEFPYSFLQHQVMVEDKTGQVVAAIVKRFMDYYNENFKRYVDAAIEDCNYNSYDQKFNEFFITKIIADYEDDPTSAPWFQMCILYHMQIDMIFDVYGGNTALMFDEALRESEKIAPTNGTLTGLLAFDAKVRDLIETQFPGSSFGGIDSGTSIMQRMVLGGFSEFTNISELAGRVETRRFHNGNGDGSETTLQCEMFNQIPEPINFVNTISDGMPEGLDIMSDCVSQIWKFSRYLVSYYCVEGHIPDYRYSSAAGILIFDGSLHRQYFAMYNYNSGALRTMLDSISSGADDYGGLSYSDVSSYLSGYYDATFYSAIIMGDGYHDSYNKILGTTVAKYIVERVIHHIEVEAIVYDAFLSTSEQIDMIHKHSLMTVQQATVSSDLMAESPGRYSPEGIALEYIISVKRKVQQDFGNIILKRYETASERSGMTVINKIRDVNAIDATREYSAVSADLIDAGVKDSGDLYLDYRTLCDNLVGVVLATYCIMAKRTQNYVSYGNNSTGFTFAEISTFTLDDGLSLKQHIFEDIVQNRNSFIQNVDEYGFTTVGGLPSNMAKVADIYPQRLKMFTGVYEFASGAATIQQGTDVLDLATDPDITSTGTTLTDIVS
tara:strand:- start:8077 stop:13047 length:4971 start_codon:yes stop_codon:yes gene_type:complete